MKEKVGQIHEFKVKGLYQVTAVPIARFKELRPEAKKGYNVCVNCADALLLYGVKGNQIKQTLRLLREDGYRAVKIS